MTLLKSFNEFHHAALETLDSEAQAEVQWWHVAHLEPGVPMQTFDFGTTLAPWVFR